MKATMMLVMVVADGCRRRKVTFTSNLEALSVTHLTGKFMPCFMFCAVL